MQNSLCASTQPVRTSYKYAPLQDGLVEEALGQVGQHHEVGRHGAGRLPGQGYVVWVPSEALNVVINPL